MQNYSFSFSNSYSGHWSIPEIGNNIPGTLIMDKTSIRLELFWNNYKRVNTGKYKSITGYAFPADSEKVTCYYFNLNEIYLNYVSFFGNGQSIYKFDIGSFFISDIKNYDITRIHNSCIRTKLLDKWVWEYSCNYYECKLPVVSDRLSFSYEPPKSLTLFEDSKIKVYIKFGSGFSSPNASGFSMSTHAFLNILNKETISFEDSLGLSEYLYDLFSLLFGNNTPPDFMEFRSDDAIFIFKRSPQTSYQFVNEDTSLSSSLVDFLDNDDLNLIINKWLSLLDNEKYSVESYYETIRDEHIPLSASIKNYISVIEGLSKGLKIQSSGQAKGTKKENRIKELINKIQGLSQSEINEIKMLVTRESSKEPKLILKQILIELSNQTSVIVEKDFCKKAVNTRNYITHTNARETNIYQKNEYWDVSFALENIIAAFLLYKIGVNSHLIKKIVPEIKCDPSAR